MHASTLSAQRITVCGDLHGKLNDLLLIFWKVKMPPLFTILHSICNIWFRGSSFVQYLFLSEIIANSENRDNFLSNFNFTVQPNVTEVK